MILFVISLIQSIKVTPLKLSVHKKTWKFVHLNLNQIQFQRFKTVDDDIMLVRNQLAF